MTIETYYVEIHPGSPLFLVGGMDISVVNSKDASATWILQLRDDPENVDIFVVCYFHGAVPKRGEQRLINLSVVDFVNRGRDMQ